MREIETKDMIPHIIHYCWLGENPLPILAEECIASWHQYMPDWQYMRWDENSLTRAHQPIPSPYPKGKGEKCSWLDYMPTYVKQAYEAKKYAFVSDYVRLWALKQYGGLYMDVDFEVFRPFDDLMDRYPAFAGYEGSKRQPVMQGVIASEPHGAWVQDMLQTYQYREFIKDDGSLDLTPNTTFFSDRLEAQGFIPDGVEKDFFVTDERVSELVGEQENCESSLNRQPSTYYLHVFPVYYFCPILTTGEDVRTSETYCIHRGLRSWNTTVTWKMRLMKHIRPEWRIRIIKLKRKLFG